MINHEYAQTSATQTGVAVSAPDRESIIKEFDWAITDLDKVITQLFDRLDPVLSPVHPDAAMAGEPMAAVSIARGRLQHLHGLTGSLRQMLDRLEV